MSSQTLVDTAVELESSVWRALVEGDRDADQALLSERFVGVYPTGFADRADHAEQLADGPTVVEYEILSPSVIEIDQDCLLLVYEAHYRRTVDGESERMYVSSLWQRSDGRWRNLFSQDTPAAVG